MNPYYQQNGITIYHAQWQNVISTLPDIDLILTDPPYGINVTKMTLGNGKNKIYRGSGDWDNAAPSKSDFEKLLSLCDNQIFWGGNYFADKLPASRGWLVWDKKTGANSFADCELAWTNLDTVVKIFRKSWVGANAKDTTRRIHPTQKPVSLMRWCIKIGNGNFIFDPYMGSGSTLKAALEMGVQAIGCETEEHFCEKAAERLRQPSLIYDA